MNSNRSVQPVGLRKATLFDVSKLLFIGALWGASFIFMSLALASYGPISIAAWRIVLAAVVLLLISFFSGQALPKNFRDWKKLTLIGFLNSALPFSLISWGLQFISSAEAAVLMATGTFSALILSHFFSADERINPARTLGVLTGFCGVLVLVISALLETGLGAFKGQIAVMLSGVCYASSTVMARRIAHIPSLPAAAGIMLSASVYMMLLAWLFEYPFTLQVNQTSMLAVLFLGVFSTALALVIRLSIIRHNGAVFMSQVGYLVPLFGVFWSWLFLTNTIGPQTLIALGLILLGIMITRRGS